MPHSIARRKFRGKLTQTGLFAASLALVPASAQTPTPPSVQLGAALEEQLNAGKAPPGLTPPPTDPGDLEGTWLPFQSAPPGGAPPPPPPSATKRFTGASAVERPPPPLGIDLLANDENKPFSVQQCAPMRVFGTAFDLQLVQTADDVVLIGEDAEYARVIRINGHHPAKLTYSQNGDSIGHWDGNTLVVDTIGIAAQNSAPLPLHLTERISKSADGKTLQISTTAQLTGQPPGRSNLTTARWRPDMHLAESICEEGFAHFHLVNGKLEIDDAE